MLQEMTVVSKEVNCFPVSYQEHFNVSINAGCNGSRDSIEPNTLYHVTCSLLAEWDDSSRFLPFWLPC